jgi:exopolysaccharide production protein ExoZ
MYHFRRCVDRRGNLDPVLVWPYGRTGSGGCFDSGPDVLIFELRGGRDTWRLETPEQPMSPNGRLRFPLRSSDGDITLGFGASAKWAKHLFDMSRQFLYVSAVWYPEGWEDAISRTLAPWLRRTFELQDPQHARLLPMEGLRGLAVTLVFLQHYTVQSQLIGLSPGPAFASAAAFRSYGNFGVELFFVLSGYLIYGTLVRRAPPFIGFMSRRLQRIYPAFLVVFAFALALTILTPIPGKIPHDPWQAAVYLVTNLALLPGLIPMVRIVDVAWSLSYEMFFYVVTAGLVLGAGMSAMRPGRRITILTLLTGAFILASCAEIPNFPVRMMPFFAGMLLAEGLGNRVPSWLGWAAPVAAFVASVMHAIPSVAGELVQTVAFFLLCAVCFRSAGLVSTWMTWAPLRWLGNMSYSYYLVHGFVVRIAMIMLAQVLPLGMPDAVFWGFMPVLYVATLLASSLLFVIVEKPISLQPAAPTISTLQSYFRLSCRTQVVMGTERGTED